MVLRSLKKLDASKNEFLVVAAGRYFNLGVEYLVLIATAALLPPFARAEYVMLVGVIAICSVIGGLAYEQYGSVVAFKACDSISAYNYFRWLVLWSIVVGFFGAVSAYVYIYHDVFMAFTVWVSTIALTIYKQIIVLFQLNNKVRDYFKLYVLCKIVFILAILAALLEFKTAEAVMAAFAISSVIHACLSVRICPEFNWISKLSVKKFIDIFKRHKLMYATGVVTSVYGYVDLFMIYKSISKPELAAYNIAIQLNAAVAVIGQAYSVYVYSNQDRTAVANIVKSIRNINYIIVFLSVVAIVAVYSGVIGFVVDLILNGSYKNIQEILEMTIFMLPAALVSMFYAPLWIVMERYIFLFSASCFSIALFVILALSLSSKGLVGIIYAQYIVGGIGIAINYWCYRYAKRQKVVC